MKFRVLLFFLLGVLVVAGLLTTKRLIESRAEAAFERDLRELTATPPQSNGARKPVVVELFTSEGCSSCPPADALLLQLEKSQPVEGAEIIALSQHVDYWNHLGWADPYSSKMFSERQSEYSSAFGHSDIYTPQMVVDGQAEFVGSNVKKAREAIAKAAAAPKATVTITLSSQTKAVEREATININNLPKAQATEPADVMIAVTESGLSSSVSRGENTGRKLTHTAVVRKLEAVGTIKPGEEAFKTTRTVTIEKGWKRDTITLVVFAQERKSRRILGAASVKLNEP